MTDWSELVRMGCWDLIPIYDLADDGRFGELQGILDASREFVGCINERNGMEMQERPRLPHEIDDSEQHAKAKRAAAAVLAREELQTLVEGEPVTALAHWQDLRAMTINSLHALSLEVDKLEGTPELSRDTHVMWAVQLLDEIDKIRSVALSEADGPDDHRWISELVAEAALTAFWAGRRTQAAYGKRFEEHAVRGEKMVEDARKGGEARRGKLSPRTEEILSKMDEIRSRNPKMSVTAAAMIAHSQGYGTSAEANRALWKNHRKAKCG